MKRGNSKTKSFPSSNFKTTTLKDETENLHAFWSRPDAKFFKNFLSVIQSCSYIPLVQVILRERQRAKFHDESSAAVACVYPLIFDAGFVSTLPVADQFSEKMLHSPVLLTGISIYVHHNNRIHRPFKGTF